MKYKTLIVTFTLACSFLFTAANRMESPATSLSIGSGIVAKGDSKTLSASAYLPEGVKLGAATVDILYNPSVVDATACNVDPGGFFDSKVCNVNFDNNGSNPDIVRFTLLAINGASGNITLANITFVGAGSPGDSTPVEIMAITLADPNGNTLPTTFSNGSLSMPAPIPTDTPVTPTNTPFPTNTPTDKPTPTKTPKPSKTPLPINTNPPPPIITNTPYIATNTPIPVISTNTPALIDPTSTPLNSEPTATPIKPQSSEIPSEETQTSEEPIPSLTPILLDTGLLPTNTPMGGNTPTTYFQHEPTLPIVGHQPTDTLPPIVPGHCNCTWRIVGIIVNNAAEKTENPSLSNEIIITELTNWCCQRETQNMLNSIAGWYLATLIDAGITSGGDLYDAGVHVASAIHNTQPDCINVVMWWQTYISKMIAIGYHSNIVITESPVYPLAISGSSQAGFLENGQTIGDLLDARVLQYGEKRIILFSGQENTVILITGYNDGAMNLHTTFNNVYEGRTTSFENIKVVKGMLALVDTSGNDQVMRIDDDRDGQMNRFLQPSKVLLLCDSSKGPTVERPIAARLFLFASVIFVCALLLVIAASFLLAGSSKSATVIATINEFAQIKFRRM